MHFSGCCYVCISVCKSGWPGTFWNSFGWQLWLCHLLTAWLWVCYTASPGPFQVCGASWPCWLSFCICFLLSYQALGSFSLFCLKSPLHYVFMDKLSLLSMLLTCYRLSSEHSCWSGSPSPNKLPHDKPNYSIPFIVLSGTWNNAFFFLSKCLLFIFPH